MRFREHAASSPEPRGSKMHISTAGSRIRENSEGCRRGHPVAPSPNSHEFGYLHFKTGPRILTNSATCNFKTDASRSAQPPTFHQLIASTSFIKGSR